MQFDKLETEKRKNSQAKIKANNKYKNKTYKRIGIDVKPEQALYIRAKAERLNISIAQLIIRAVENYEPENISTAEETTEQTAEP